MLGVLFLTLDLFAYHNLALGLIDRGSGLSRQSALRNVGLHLIPEEGF